MIFIFHTVKRILEIFIEKRAKMILKKMAQLSEKLTSSSDKIQTNANSTRINQALFNNNSSISSNYSYKDCVYWKRPDIVANNSSKRISVSSTNSITNYYGYNNFYSRNNQLCYDLSNTSSSPSEKIYSNNQSVYLQTDLTSENQFIETFSDKIRVVIRYLNSLKQVNKDKKYTEYDQILNYFK
jgi:hypothetical protein